MFGPSSKRILGSLAEGVHCSVPPQAVWSIFRVFNLSSKRIHGLLMFGPSSNRILGWECSVHFRGVQTLLQENPWVVKIWSILQKDPRAMVFSPSSKCLIHPPRGSLGRLCLVHPPEGSSGDGVQCLPRAPTVTEKCVLAVGLTYWDNGGGKMLLGPLGGSHVRKHRFHLFLRPPTQEPGNSRRCQKKQKWPH